MKRILLLVSFYSIATANAQEVMEAKTEYQKTPQPSVMVELPYESGIVEDAIKDYFIRIGVKADDSRGFQVFRSTKLGMTDAWNSDLYFKVERKGRKDKAGSVVYFFATPEKQQPNLRKPGDYYGVDGARIYLKNMLPSIDSYDLGVQIRTQEEEVRKAEKKYQRMIEEGDDLDKRLRKVQENIQENKNNMAVQKLEIDNQRKLLEMLKAKKR